CVTTAVLESGIYRSVFGISKVHQMQSILSVLTFFILTTIAVPQSHVALQAPSHVALQKTNISELESYKWVCRDHKQGKGVGRKPYIDSACRWVSSKDSNDFNGTLDSKVNIILMLSALVLLHTCI
ncbi:hypothetical protein BC833DRAFT_569989, partial [Globomyces pollinis-pini]